MEKQFEAVFELFDIDVRRLRNGHKMRLTFESAEDVDVEEKLIRFRGELVSAIIGVHQEDQGAESVTIEDKFEVFDIKVRRLRNGDKLCLVLEQMYEKQKEVNAAKLRFQDCKVFFKSVDQQLDLEGDDE